MVNKLIKSWWNWLRWEPNDPRLRAGGMIKIAAIGGGTGLSTLIRGLKKYSNNISAIVAVTDDGASSGKIRKEYDILPPGDLRKCISALAVDEVLLTKIFEYRFSSDKKIFGGHSLGNIWLTALANQLGSLDRAIEATSGIFKLAGQVLSATPRKIRLRAKFSDGTMGAGESKISRAGKTIERIWLDKKNVRANKNAVLAIDQADLILIGPGSLYTSVIPNLLISGITKAVLANKKAVKIYIANCSTERGETEHYGVSEHIETLQKYSSKRIVKHCLVNSRVMQCSANDSKLGEVNNITTSEKKIAGVKISRHNVVSAKDPLYHDPDKLAKAVIEIYNSSKL